MNATEIAERKSWAEGQPRAFVIFEGCCPDCYEDIKETDRSEEISSVDNPKWYEFTCSGCGKVHFVEQVAGGDWATN